jgi:hypothetical protein
MGDFDAGNRVAVASKTTITHPHTSVRVKLDFVVATESDTVHKKNTSAG